MSSPRENSKTNHKPNQYGLCALPKMCETKQSLHDDFGIKSKYSDTSRWYVNRFIHSIAGQLKPGLRLLDAGAGECAYKHCLSHLDYIATDLAVGDVDWNYTNLDVIARLHSLCFQDDSFDAVLCTQVLEHLEWPRESVAEFYRVLKPGGLLFITVPMAQNEHQVPYDFFRYTSFGVRSICEHAGFVVIEVLPFGGFFTRWAYELPNFFDYTPPHWDNQRSFTLPRYCSNTDQGVYSSNDKRLTGYAIRLRPL